MYVIEQSGNVESADDVMSSVRGYECVRARSGRSRPLHGLVLAPNPRHSAATGVEIARVDQRSEDREESAAVRSIEDVSDLSRLRQAILSRRGCRRQTAFSKPRRGLVPDVDAVCRNSRG